MFMHATLGSRGLAALSTLALLGGVAMSCADPAPPPSTPAPARTAVVRIDAGAPVVKPPAVIVDAGTDAAKIADAATPSIPTVDADDWFIPRGVSQAEIAKLDPSNCEELTVGPAHEPAIVCNEMKELTRISGKTTLYWMLTHRAVHVVRAKKIVTVLEADVQLEPLDKSNSLQPDVVNLALHLAPDGLSATLDEHVEPHSFAPPIPCAQARRGNSEAFIHDVIARMCGKLGSFTWRKDTFVREAFTQPLPLSSATPRPTLPSGDPFANGAH